MKMKKFFAGFIGAVMLCTVVSAASYDSPSVSADDAQIVYTTGFEDNKIDFTGRGGVENISISSNQAHSGTYSMEVSGRTSTWNGPQMQIDTMCESNKEYTVNAYVKTDSSDNVKLSLQYTDSLGKVNYNNLFSAASNGDWAEFSNVKFSFSDTVSNVYIYFESDNTTTMYIDDFTISETAVIPIQEDIVSLKDYYSKYFKIGTAMGPSNLSSTSFMNLFKKHFSESVTLGNELKPDYVLDQSASQEKGNNINPQVNFMQADAMLQYCEDNNIPMRGHTLIWHSQTPDWFFKEGFSDDGDWVDKETMLTRMENYIKNVMEGLAEQYPNLEFYAWDVVNEAWLDNGSARQAGSSKSEDSETSAWVRIFGDNSFIEPAFEYARKYAPEGCKLYYNDFNEYITGKTNAIYNMAMELKEKGLIDGIGMQSHLDVTYPSVSQYKAAIEKFASTGLDIQITELDITTSDTSESGLEKQAQFYSDVFDIYVDYADYISAVVLWGITDDQSWRASGVPLLFDANFQAKPAFYAIVDGEELPTEPTTEPTTENTTSATTEATTESITVTEEETQTTVPIDFIPGDVTCDKSINVFDVIALRDYIVNNASLDYVKSPYTSPSDTNGNGYIEVSDLVLLQQFLVGKDVQLTYYTGT